MELIKRNMPMDCEIFDVGDLHRGPLNCHREATLEVINMIAAKPNRYIWTKGDALDSITPSDKRFSSLSVEIRKNWRTPQDHADQLIEDFYPIRDRVLVWMIGNHEWKLLNTLNFGTYIADRLRVPYGSVICKFIYMHKDKVQFKSLLWHGYGALRSQAKDPIQREANRKAALKQKLDQLAHTDCIYKTMGHTHQLLVVQPTIGKELMLIDDGEKLHQMNRYSVPQNSDFIPADCCWYGNSGSFLKLYSEPGSGNIAYGELTGFAPAEIGCLKLTIQGGQLINVEKVVL